VPAQGIDCEKADVRQLAGLDQRDVRISELTIRGVPTGEQFDGERIAEVGAASRRTACPLARPRAGNADACCLPRTAMRKRFGQAGMPRVDISPDTYLDK